MGNTIRGFESLLLRHFIFLRVNWCHIFILCHHKRFIETNSALNQLSRLQSCNSLPGGPSPLSDRSRMKKTITQIFYGAFIASVGIAAQWLLWPWVGPSRFILLYPTIIVGSITGGLYSGITTLLVSAALAFYLFFPPPFSLGPEKASELVPLLVFLSSGLAINVIAILMQRKSAALLAERTVNQAQTELQKTQSILHEAMEQSQAGIAISDANGTLRFVNDAGLEIPGGDRATLVEGVGTDQFVKRWKISSLSGAPVTPHDLPLSRALLTGERASGELVINRSETDHRVVWASAAPVRNEKGQIIAGVVVFLDITERKTLETEKALLASIVENSEDAIFSVDLKGQIQSWNRGAENLYSYTAQEALGRATNFLTPPDRQTEENNILFRISQGERISHLETVRLTKDHRRIDVSISTSPITDAQGKILGASKIVRDISQRKKLEHSLLSAKEAVEDAMRIKSRFLDIAAHELRTPVTGFSLLLQFAQKQLEKHNRPIDLATVKKLQAQADRISRLVVDLLDVSRLERGVLRIKPVLTDPSSLTSDCVELFRLQAPNRKITIKKPDESIEIQLDRDRIFQVISNFLDNAIKYSPPDSPIEVEFEIESDHARISVRDFGPGIEENLRATLFNPFERGTGDSTESVGGLGLGLFVCRGIVELHGGKIGVQSKVGQGSQFFFDLPLNRSARKAA